VIELVSRWNRLGLGGCGVLWNLKITLELSDQLSPKSAPPAPFRCLHYYNYFGARKCPNLSKWYRVVSYGISPIFHLDKGIPLSSCFGTGDTLKYSTRVHPQAHQTSTKLTENLNLHIPHLKRNSTVLHNLDTGLEDLLSTSYHTKFDEN